MKKNDLNKLKAKKAEELKKIGVDKKVELIKISAEVTAGNESNNKKAKNLKRDIAQILTIIREKEIVEKIEEKNIVKSKK